VRNDVSMFSKVEGIEMKIGGEHSRHITDCKIFFRRFDANPSRTFEGSRHSSTTCSSASNDRIGRTSPSATRSTAPPPCSLPVPQCPH
jgi:hypothetical protein